MAEQTIKKNTALEKALPAMARDIGVMKMGIMKLVSIQAGTPRSKAEQFFAGQASKESAYEAKFAKSPTASKTKTSTGGSRGGKGLGFGPGTSVLDFIKNIANMLIKGALLSAGTFGLAKLLENDDVRNTIKSFIKNLFTSIMNVIQKGAQMLTETMKENWPEIKEAIINTFLAIKNLLVAGIEKTGDILSDKRIWEGLYEIIKTIFDAIKKVLSTEVEIEGVKVSLGTVLGAVIVAFGALKGAVFLLKAAAESAAKSLFGIGGGGADVPDVDKGDKKKGPYRDPKTGRYTKTPPRPPVTMANRLLAGGVVGGVVAAGTAITYGAAKTLEGMSKDELDVLAQSGGGDDTAMAAAILSQSKTPTPAPKNNRTVEGTVTRAYTKSAPDEFDKSLLNTIAKGESGGDYNSMNQGGTKDKGIYGSGNSMRVIGKNLTEMTVGEVITRGAKPSDSPEKRKKEGLIFAAGRYQIVPDTLKRLVNAGVVSKGDKFDAATQDRLGKALLEEAGLSSFKAGKMPASQFQNNVSKVWGAIANTSGQSSLGGPNKANLAASSQFATLLAGGKVEEAPVQVAAATPTAALPAGQVSTTTPPAEEENPLVKMLLDFDKLTGGKLGFDSKELSAAMNMIGKEIMSGPTFVDNSTNVSKAGGDVVAAQGSPAVRDENILNKIMAMRVA
jgi:hypothetical protein